jgi:hypothetical protein
LPPATSNQLLVQTNERLVHQDQPLCLQVGRRFRDNEPTDLMDESTDLTNKTTCPKPNFHAVRAYARRLGKARMSGDNYLHK